MKNVFQHLLLAFVLLFPGVAVACECPPLDPISEKLSNNYNVIFYGQVDSVSQINSRGKASAYFNALKLYKGKVQHQVEVEFDASTDCMMSFGEDDEWIVYANFHRFDELTVNLCEHSRKMIKGSTVDYYQLAAGRTFSEERAFLNKTLGMQPFEIPSGSIEQHSNFKHHNKQPSSINKLLLLLSSFIVMVIVYFITRKKKE